MFGKLLKNDIKAQWHSVSTIFLSIFIIAGFAELLVIYSIKDVFNIWNDKKLIFVAIGGIVVCLAMFFACIVILIAVGLMFSKTTFGRAGYLTLTLPVKTGSLIWSKIISGLIWTYITYMLFFGSFFLWIYQVGECMGGDLQDLADQLFMLLLGQSTQTMISLAVYYLVWVAIAMFLVVQCMYLGITCAHISPLSKLGPIATVLIFFGSFGVIVGLTLIVGKIIPFGMVVHDDVITISSNVVKAQQELYRHGSSFVFSGPLFMLLSSILLSSPITYLTKHKANIK
ncbi:MAG: hypothetical protein E7530_07830 [Ruminococcaceae bacterium]|nr:hypothetical protein [Oscillospiraceae bacterium]